MKNVVYQFSKLAFFRFLIVLQFCLGGAALYAQSGGRLYDPEPPADSGYVRVVMSAPVATQDIWIDGKPRIRKLAGQTLSEYMVLLEGKHTISIHPEGTSAKGVSFPVEVLRGKSVTLAFSGLSPDTVPVRLEDKGNTNKLKVMLTAYHLAAKVGAIDLNTVDGASKVFSAISYGQVASLQVNPVTVNLVATQAGSSVALAKFPLELAQGGSYSVLITTDSKGKLAVQTVLNKIERFTGK